MQQMWAGTLVDLPRMAEKLGVSRQFENEPACPQGQLSGLAQDT